MPPSNMSIQTGSDRPSMKQDDHPDHNMPESEHDGEELKTMFDPIRKIPSEGSLTTDGRQMLEDRKNYGKNNY